MKTKDWTIFIYSGSLLIIHLVYIAVFLGIFVTIPGYIRLLNRFIQVFLCFFLMFRFHPFRENYKLKTGDTMFIFGAAIILFTNIVLVELSSLPIIGTYVKRIVSMLPSSTYSNE
jgi:hypothetical protein